MFSSSTFVLMFFGSPLAEGMKHGRFRTLRSAIRGFAPWTPPPLKRRAKLFFCDSALFVLSDLYVADLFETSVAYCYVRLPCLNAPEGHFKGFRIDMSNLKNACIGNIKYILHFRRVAGIIHKADAFGSLMDISVHRLRPVGRSSQTKEERKPTWQPTSQTPRITERVCAPSSTTR